MKMSLDLLLVGGRLGRRKRGVGVSYCLGFPVPTSPICGGRREVLHGSSLGQISGLFLYLHLGEGER